MNDARHTPRITIKLFGNRQSSGQTLKVFYWTTGLGAALLAIFASYFCQIISSILWVVATLAMYLAVSPASTVVSVHQWMAGGVTGVRTIKPPWHCTFGSKSCRRSKCCPRCAEVLDEDSPVVRGYRANLSKSKALYQNIYKLKRIRYAQDHTPVGDRSQYDGPYDPERWNSEAQASFQRIESALEEGIMMVNVYGASEGTPNNSISEEGERSGLTSRGYGMPTIVMNNRSMRKTMRGGPVESVWYTPLDGPERRKLGAPGVELFNARHDARASSEVERRTQLLVEEYILTHTLIEKAWTVAGAGYPKGLPPFKVGFRLFPINHDGTFLVPGAVRRGDEPGDEA